DKFVSTGILRMGITNFPVAHINGQDNRISVDVAVLDTGIDTGKGFNHNFDERREELPGCRPAKRPRSSKCETLCFDPFSAAGRGGLPDSASFSAGKLEPARLDGATGPGDLAAGRRRAG